MSSPFDSGEIRSTTTYIFVSCVSSFSSSSCVSIASVDLDTDNAVGSNSGSGMLLFFKDCTV